MAMNLVKLPTGKSNLQLRVSKGHYATATAISTTTLMSP